jgi:diguanylate cyclase (GGDEF)-like protein
VLAREVYAARRDGTPMALLLVDVDDIGLVSRRAGVRQSDLVVAEVGAMVREAASNAVSCRVGGDAFAVAALGSTVTDAERILAALRASLTGIGVTASAGIAELDRCDDDWISMLVRADAALRHAKAAGRDCASVAPAHGSIARDATRAAGPR